MTLEDLLLFAEYYTSMGHAIQVGASNLERGSRLEDQHIDALPVLEELFIKASDFIGDPAEALDIVDNIQMFLFGRDTSPPRQVGPFD